MEKSEDGGPMRVRYECQDGYRLLGEETRTCDGGDWGKVSGSILEWKGLFKIEKFELNWFTPFHFEKGPSGASAGFFIIFFSLRGIHKWVNR